MGTKNETKNTCDNSTKWHHIEEMKGVIYREHPTRKNGRWPDRYIAIRYRTAEGKRNLEALGWVSEGHSLDKAFELINLFKKNIKTGERPQSLREKREMEAEEKQRREQEKKRAARENMTFGELASLYQDWAKNNRVWEGQIDTNLRLHVLPVIGHLEITKITPQVVADLRTALSKKHPQRGGSKRHIDENRTLSQQTVLHCIKLVREAYNYAAEVCHENAPSEPLFKGINPARMSKRSKVLGPLKFDNRRMRVFNDDQVAELLAYEGGKSQKRETLEIRDMILLSVDIGLRASELTLLKKHSVDPETGAVTVVQGSKRNDTTKSAKSRVVFAGMLFPETLEMLRLRVAMHPGSPWLFPGRGDGPRDANGLNRLLRRIIDEKGWNNGVTDTRLRLVWHSLRHKYATERLERGCDIYDLKTDMGHNSIKTTEIYLHICDKKKREKALAELAMIRQYAEEKARVNTGKEPA